MRRDEAGGEAEMRRDEAYGGVVSARREAGIMYEMRGAENDIMAVSAYGGHHLSSHKCRQANLITIIITYIKIISEILHIIAIFNVIITT